MGCVFAWCELVVLWFRWFLVVVLNLSAMLGFAAGLGGEVWLVGLDSRCSVI